MDIKEIKGILEDFHHTPHPAIKCELFDSFKATSITELLGSFEGIENRKGHTEPVLFGGSLEWMPLIAIYDQGKAIGFMEFKLELMPVYSGYEAHFCLEYLYLNKELRGNGVFSDFIDCFSEALLNYISPWFEANDDSYASITYSAEYISVQGRKVGERLLESLEEFTDELNCWELNDSSI